MSVRLPIPNVHRNSTPLKVLLRWADLLLMWCGVVGASGRPSVMWLRCPSGTDPCVSGSSWRIPSEVPVCSSIQMELAGRLSDYNRSWVQGLWQLHLGPGQRTTPTQYIWCPEVPVLGPISLPEPGTTDPFFPPGWLPCSGGVTQGGVLRRSDVKEKVVF